MAKMLKFALMKLIELNIDKIKELCKQYRVKTLSVFGSILTDRFNDKSDVDLLVRFEEDVNYTTYGDNYFGFIDSLRALFNRDIDLVDETTVRNKYFREELNETKHLIYG